MVFDNKFLATLIGISLAFIAVTNFKSGGVQENFLGTLPSFTTKVVKDVKCVPKQSSEMYMVPGTFESNLAPRFSNTNYGANIQYNIPCRSMLATPEHSVPLQESFTEQYSSCSDANEAKQSVYDPTEYPDVQSMIPAGTLNSLGESCEPIVYDRYIFANRNSRLRSQGDPIRGDLPIVPANTGWFRPSAHPQIDLQQGALNVIAGVSNETTQQMNQLISASSGGSVTVNAGIPITQMYSQENCAQGDVFVTAFP